MVFPLCKKCLSSEPSREKFGAVATKPLFGEQSRIRLPVPQHLPSIFIHHNAKYPYHILNYLILQDIDIVRPKPSLFLSMNSSSPVLLNVPTSAGPIACRRGAPTNIFLLRTTWSCEMPSSNLKSSTALLFKGILTQPLIGWYGHDDGLHNLTAGLYGVAL